MAARQIFFFLAIFSSTSFVFYTLAIQDFESLVFSNEFKTNKKNLREHFLGQKKQKLINGRRVKLLDKYFNTSVHVDGIPHHIIEDGNTEWKEIKEIEKEFKNLIQMNGVKYTYKRGAFWRTWRKVKYPNSTERIVCYRCATSINSTNCQYNGYWVIEDQPPLCPFEIFSVINDKEVCAINLSNSTNIEKNCPLIVQFTDLTSWCDNPIKTKWRIMKIYSSNASERFPEVICNGRDFCEISTVYTITKDYVSFRIINLTNYVIYSRVMKNDGKNYACVNCGSIDPNTNIISVTDKPVSFDLLKKNKREDHLKKEIRELLLGKLPPEVPLESVKINAPSSMEDFFYFHKREKHRHNPTCQSLKHNDIYFDD